MQPIRIHRTIQAPIDRVFRTVADPREFAKVQPQILEIQFLGDRQEGVGTRFRETRMMGKRRASTELEITEFVENQRVRFVADSHGSIWDTLFTVAPGEQPDTTDLHMAMTAQATNLFARLMNALAGGMIRKAVAEDMDRVKARCEQAQERN